VNEHTPETQPLPRGCQVVDNRDQSRRWWGGGLRPMMGASYLVIDEENTVCGYGGTPSEAVAHYHDRQALRPRIVLRKALAAPSQEPPPEQEGSSEKTRPSKGMTVLLQRVGTLIRRAFTRQRVPSPAPPVPPSAEKRALVVLSCSYKPQQGREDE
jgi:hypothetical protein